MVVAASLATSDLPDDIGLSHAWMRQGGWGIESAELYFADLVLLLGASKPAAHENSSSAPMIFL